MSHRLRVIVVLALLLPVLAHAQQPGRATPLTRLAIANPGPISASGSLPLVIAQEQGIFARHGLEVRLIGGPPGSYRMIGGEAEFGYFGSAAILLAIVESGRPLRILSTINSGQVSSQFVTRAGIATAADLRGTRAGVFSIGTGVWVLTIQALSHLGLDPARDNIGLVPVGNFAQLAIALDSGAIDAAMLNPAQSRQFQAKGFSVLLDLASLDIPGPQTLLVSTAPYLAQHPDVAQKVVTALVEATAFSVSPRNKMAVLAMLTRMFNFTDSAAAEQSYLDIANLNRKPYAMPDKLRGVQAVMARHDPAVLGLKIEELIEDRFVRTLDEAGTIERIFDTDAQGRSQIHR